MVRNDFDLVRRDREAASGGVARDTPEGHRRGNGDADGAHAEQIVRLVHADRSALRAHLLRLSPRDRRLRFGGVLDDPAIDRYVEAIDLDHDVILAARHAGGTVIGVAELRATREAPHEREIAFSVDPERRDRGCATRLVAASIATARGCRFGRLHALCSPANQGMLDILARAGFTVERRGVDVVTYLVLAPPPAKTADSTDSAPRRDKGLDPPRTGSAASDERMAGLQERDGHCRGR